MEGQSTKKTIILLTAVATLLLSSCASGKYRYKKSSDKLISPEGIEYLRYPYPGNLCWFDEESALGEIEINDVEWDIYSLKDNDSYLVLEPSDRNITVLDGPSRVFVMEGVEYPTVFDADRVKSISFVDDWYSYEFVTECLENPVFEDEAAVDFMKKLTETPIDRRSISGCRTIGYIYVTYTGAESIYSRCLILGNGERMVLCEYLGNGEENDFEISEELYNELINK